MKELMLTKQIRMVTPFYIACEKGQTEIVKVLLNDQRVDKTNVTNSGSTSFYIACQNGHIEVVKLLLLNEKRIYLNKASYTGETPFYIACQNGHIEIVKLLLNDERVDINKANKDGTTPFFVACLNGHIEIVKYFFSSGREIDIKKKDKDGKTALDCAKQKGKRLFKNEEQEQARKKNSSKIVELIESFQKNQNETRVQLRKELGLTGKFIFLI